MKKAFILILCACALAALWKWKAAREPASSAKTEQQQVVVPALQPATPKQTGVTNIPGIGPVPTDPKELEKFKAKAKREMQAAMRTVGVFSNRDDMKQAQDSGELAWIYIEQRKNLQLAMDHIHSSAVEPFPPRMLEALQHILAHAETPQLKTAAAMLLFRYDQPPGRDYLLKALNAPSMDLLIRDVIYVLAKNQVREAVPGIAAAFPRMGAPYEADLLALGQWGAPGVMEAVRQRYALEPKNYGYALCFAQAGDPGSVAPLRAALATRGSTPTGNVIRSALARVGALDSETWHEEMELAWANHRSLSEAAIAHYLDTAGPAVAKGMAERCLKACIPLHEAYVAGMESQAKGIREKIPELANKFPKPPPSEFVMGAAQLLAQWDAKETVPTLQQVLTTVQQGGRANVYVNEALGLALYKLDPANWRATMLNAGIPQYHVDRIPELAKLRPIPPAYLPKQVNLKAR